MYHSVLTPARERGERCAWTSSRSCSPWSSWLVAQTLEERGRVGMRALRGLRAGRESEKDEWGLAATAACLGEWLSGIAVGMISSL
jgi:hypothetical protein